MMQLILQRIAKRETYTIGKLYIDGVYFCDTIEDKVRDLDSYDDKVYGKTAIPEGTYELKITYSNKYKRMMPQIMNVPFFEGVRLHSGNKAEDSLGCPLVGENKIVGQVINSRVTYKKLMNILKEDAEMTIIVR